MRRTKLDRFRLRCAHLVEVLAERPGSGALLGVFLLIFIFLIVFSKNSTPHAGGISGWIESLAFSIPSAIAAFSMLFAGMALYAVRCRFPEAYGFAEVAVGVGLGWYALMVLYGKMHSGAHAAVAALASLYIIVRGLDNLYRSFPAGTVLVKAWNNVFFGRTTSAKL